MAIVTANEPMTEIGQRTKPDPSPARDELSEQLADMTGLLQLATRLTSLDPDQVLEEVLAAITSLQGSTMGTVLRWDADQGALTVAASVGFTPEQLALVGRLPWGVGPCGRALARGHHVIVEDVEHDPTFEDCLRPFAHAAGFRAVYTTPLITRGGDVLGSLATYFRQPHRPTDREMRLVELYAYEAAGAMDNARLYAEAQAALERERRRADQLRELSEASLAINATLSLDAVLQRITDQAREIIGAHLAIISLTVNDDWAQVIQASSLSDKYAAYRSFNTPPNGTGIYSLVCRENRPMRLTQTELEAHPDWHGFGAFAGQHPPLRGWLAVPLVGREGRNLGVLQISDRHEGEFTVEDEAILVQLAQLAAVAIENARLYHAAQAAVSVRDEFLANVSHDLRSPLTAVKAAAQLVNRRLRRADGELAARLRADVARIEDAAGRMAEMIDGLLDVARLQAGHPLDLRPQATDLVALTRGELEQQRKTTDRHAFALEAEEPALLGWWDPPRLAQVLANLLGNAVKYSPDGGRVSVTIRREAGADGAAEWAALTVRDDGVGVPPADLPRVFDQFYRGTNAIGRFSGSGIGLAGARRIIEQHGGTIGVESRDGEGSAFTVRLPLGAPATSPSNRAAGDDDRRP